MDRLDIAAYSRRFSFTRQAQDNRSRDPLDLDPKVCECDHVPCPFQSARAAASSTITIYTRRAQCSDPSYRARRVGVASSPLLTFINHVPNAFGFRRIDASGRSKCGSRWALVCIKSPEKLESDSRSRPVHSRWAQAPPRSKEKRKGIIDAN